MAGRRKNPLLRSAISFVGPIFVSLVSADLVEKFRSTPSDIDLTERIKNTFERVPWVAILAITAVVTAMGFIFGFIKK